MKIKIIVVFCLLILVLFLSGCATLEGSKIILEERELDNSDTTNMQLVLNYTHTFGDPPIQNFYIQFITGKHLEVRKEGESITEDVLYDVTGPTVANYTVYASGVYSGQEVETIEAAIVSNDKKVSKKITSEFIIIR